jgi:hypothetical protein
VAVFLVTPEKRLKNVLDIPLGPDIIGAADLKEAVCEE